MSSQPLCFRIPDSQPQEQILTALRGAFNLQEEEERTLAQTYYDSFDWRLYGGGSVLRCEREGRERRLVWSDPGELHSRETQRLAGDPPRFGQDLPPGVMREGLMPLLEMRALLPQVEVKSRLLPLRVTNRDDKTVLRLTLEWHRSREPGRAEYHDLDGRLCLRPVRGYVKTLQRMQAFLGEELGLPRAESGLLQPALAAIGRRPADYTSRLDFHFLPETPAGVVAREIHLHLLDTIERNLPGTRADLDSEFLHDLRVAVRRTRSALTQIKGVFPPAAVESFGSRFAWVGQITGPTRDLDVYLLDYERYRDSLPEPFRADLDPLRDFLVVHQRQAHQEMVKRLNSPHFRGLLKEWRAFLEQPPEADGEAPNALRPVKEVADRRIRRIYRRVLQEGSAIGDHSPPEALHDLRKSCKKLRYLMEFFQSLYPKKRIRPLIKALKGLLDNLGGFQDLEVQAMKLREFAHQMVAEDAAPADTLLAMGMLVDGLLRRQQEARRRFASEFEQFADPARQRVFRELFPGKGRRAGG